MTAVVALVAVTGACAGDATDEGAATTTTTAAPPTTTTTEPPLEAGRQIFVYVPRVGDCFDRRRIDGAGAGGGGDIVLLLDCSLPHENQVFATLQHPASAEGFPGEQALEEHARRNCVDSFEAYVGARYEVSTLEMGYYVPTGKSWDDGARLIGCYLRSMDGSRLVGSLAGSAR